MVTYYFVLELLYLLLGLLLHLFGTVASALFVVNGATKVPLVATGTGNVFDLSYKAKEVFSVLYEILNIELILPPFNVLFNTFGKLSIV